MSDLTTRKLTFVQGCDIVWVEREDGFALWQEESWGSFGQFLRGFVEGEGGSELGLVELVYREADEDEEPRWDDEEAETDNEIDAQPHRAEGCPDGGACHHECGSEKACLRVIAAGPLSGVYPGDRWPQEVRVAEAQRGIR
jgi:hypothetical protein